MFGVHLVSRKRYENKLCRARWLGIDSLNMSFTGNGWSGYRETEPVSRNLQRMYGKLPDFVIAYKPLDHIEFKNLNCQKIIQYNEIKPDKFSVEVTAAMPDIVVFHHYNDHMMWRTNMHQLGILPVHIPHVADPAIFHDQECEKLYDFAVAGNMNPVIYPMRRRFMLAMTILIARGYRCCEITHPGYELSNAASCLHLRKFADAINRSRIVCTCSSIFRYRLGKYVEVPACGTVLAADVPCNEGDDMTYFIRCQSDASPKELADQLEQELNDGLSQAYIAAGKSYAARFTPGTYSRKLLAAIDV